MSIIHFARSLQFNIRFYILATAFLASILTVSYLQLTITSEQLFYIRLQQIYGLIAVVLLYSAIILTPLSKVFKKRRWMDVLLFSRRAVGVSAAYFSLLHTVIAVFDQVGGLGNLGLLPQRFKLAFILGAIALIVLLLMAATSFDKAVTKLTFKRWKQLHSYVYLAGVLIIVHVWLIGTHADSTGIRVASAAALALLFALEAYRLVIKWTAKFKLTYATQVVTGIVLFAIMFGSLWLLPTFAGNYHSDHDETSEVAS